MEPIDQSQIDPGVAKAEAYSITMYIMAALPLVGLICNRLVRAVHERHFVQDAGIELIMYWALVGIPLPRGVSQTLANAMTLFR